jgi:hypothetical protein
MAELKSSEWLEFISNLNNWKTTTTSTVKITKKSTDNPLLSVSVDKLFELYGNLVLTGFSEDEALIIIVGIANNARNE